MAEKIGEYYYEITADNKILLKELNGAQKKVESFGAGAAKMAKGFAGAFAAAGAAIVGAFAIAQPAIREAQEAIRQDALLAGALAKTGRTLKDVSGDIQGIAEAVNIDDDDVKRIYNYGLAIGVPAERLKQFAQTALDFSARTGKSLELAMRSISGEAIKGGAAFDNLSKSVAGGAASIADLDGGFKRLDLSVKSFQEVVGKQLLVDLVPVLSILNGLVKNLQKGFEAAFGTPEEKLEKLKTKLVDTNNTLDKLYREQFELQNKRGLDKFFSSNLIKQNEAQIKANKAIQESLVKQIKLFDNSEQQIKTSTEETTAAFTEQQIQLDLLKRSMEQYGATLNQAGLNQEQLKMSTEEINASIEKVTSGLGSLIGNDSGIGKLAQQTKGIGEGLTNIVDGFAKGKLSINDLANASALWAGALGGVLMAAGAIWESFISGLDNTTEVNGRIDTINKRLEDYQATLDGINDAIDQADRKISRSQRGDQSSETLREQIKLTQEKLDGYNSALKTNNDYIRDNSSITQRDIDNRRNSLTNAITQLTAQKNNFLTNPFGIFDDTYQQGIENYKNLLAEVDAQQENLNRRNKAAADNLDIEQDILDTEAELAALRKEVLIIDNENLIATNERRAELAQLNGDQEGYQELINQEIIAYQEILAVTDDLNDQLDLKIKIKQLELSLTEKTTDELEKQKDLTSDILDQYIQGGLLDVENINQAQQAIGALAASGITGTELLGQINQLGLTGQGQNIGAINIEVNEALGETVDRAVSGRLAGLFGGK